MDDNTQHNPISQHENYSTAPSWNDQWSVIFGIGFAVLLLALAVVFWSIIPFALTTIVIAYLLDPLTDFFQKWFTRGGRGLAIAWTFVFIIMVILFVLILLMPPLIEQSISAIQSLYNSGVRFVTEPNELFNFIQNEEGETIAVWEYVQIQLQQQGFTTVNEWIIATGQNLNIDRQTILQFLNIGGDVTSSVVGSIFSIAGSAIGLIFSGLFFITILAILLNDGDMMEQTLLNATPDGYREDAKRLISDLGNVWNGYVRGNFTLGLIMGFAMWVLALVLGLPNPLFLAFIAFAVEFIPNIGPLIAMVAAVALGIVGGSATFPNLNPLLLGGIIAVIWMVMQQIESVVLVPRIVGENLKLHPVVVIFSVIWGGTFGGLIGIIIAPPLVASVRIILQYIYGRLTNRPAFISHDESEDSPAKWVERFINWIQSLNAKPKPKPAPSTEASTD